VSLVSGTGEALPFDAESFDTAVVALVLCSVAQPIRVLSEIRRVLKPRGTLRFYEHVVAERPFLAAAQHLVDPAWNRLAGGCHLDRDTIGLLSESGFEVRHCERLWFSPRLSSCFTGPRVIGLAIPTEPERRAPQGMTPT